MDTFAESYGDPQPVGAVVKRKLGEVEMRFRVNGGPTQVVPTVAYAGGERHYKDPGVYYRRVRGFVVGTKPGDSVEVWFSAGGKASAHFTYAAAVESDNPVLILANEDWSGVQPNLAGALSGPQYLDYYKAALTAAGVKYDVYDVDAHGRRAPNQLGILAHYSHVVWYTGDDYVPREPDAPGGSGITKMAVDTQNEVRDFVNDGGKLFFTGKNAGRVFAEGYDYNPFQAEEGTYCQNANPSCIAVQDDFLQYWLGAYRYVGGGGEDALGNPFPIAGTFGPFDPLSFTLNGPDSADNNDHTATLLTTSSVLDPAKYPLWADSKAVAAWQRPFASPFDPARRQLVPVGGRGRHRLQAPAQAVRDPGGRRRREVLDLVRPRERLRLPVRRDPHRGQRRLDDARRRQWPYEHDIGLSCADDGRRVGLADQPPVPRPLPDRRRLRQRLQPDRNERLVERRDRQLRRLAGVVAAHPGGVRGPERRDLRERRLGSGVARARRVGRRAARRRRRRHPDQHAPIPSFEAGMDGWTLPGPPGPAGPAGQSPVTGWVRAQSAPFIEAPVVTTTDTVYTGFGFEAITGAANRTAFMQAVLAHLGTPAKPRFDAAKPRVDAPPPAPPLPPPAVGPPPRAMTLGLLARQHLQTVRRKGVLATLGCNRRCTVRLELVVSRATQRAYRLPSRTIGRRTVTRDSGRRAYRIPLTTAAKRRLRRATAPRLTVRATWTGVRPAIVRSGTVRLRR